MWNSGHDKYLETSVLTADPIELVNMLYQAGTQAVREARLHLKEGRIAERSREITQACRIVIELASSLDHERGGEISQRLALLYDYMQRRLLEANMRQSDEPLADVLGLLTTLSEAWEGIRTPVGKPVTESAPSAQPVAEGPWPVESAWPQAVVESPWSQAVVESAWPQAVVESAWSQAAAQNPWSQPVVESPWSQAAAQNPWSQPVVESPPSSQPVAESPWSQPAVQETEYRLHAYSF